MKKIFTLLNVAIYVIATNFAIGQVTSCGQAPGQTFQPWSMPSDYSGSRVWYLDGSGQLYKAFLMNTTVTPIGSPNTYGFPAALTYDPFGQFLYSVDQLSPWTMYKLDTVTGIRTAIFNCTGMAFSNLTGIAWSTSNNTMYGVCTSLATSQTFTINMTTGVCTPIGAASATCAGAISISCPRTGVSLFVIDIVADNLYKFNRVTGAVTLVGPLGGNANYGQDAQFDLTDNKLYWASYITAPQLRLIDTAAGSSTVIGTFGLTQVAGIGPKSTIVGINNYTKDSDIHVYPNPANNIVNITAPNIETIEVSDLAGKVLENIIVNDNNARIDIGKYDAGIYFVKVKTDKGLFTKKIIVNR